MRFEVIEIPGVRRLWSLDFGSLGFDLSSCLLFSVLPARERHFKINLTVPNCSSCLLSLYRLMVRSSRLAVD